jgi:hypothetical protein
MNDPVRDSQPAPADGADHPADQLQELITGPAGVQMVMLPGSVSAPDADNGGPGPAAGARAAGRAGPRMVAPPGPMHWPSLPADRAERAWRALAEWVTALRARFPALLDRHTIPDCWWRHNQHVEALAALRDAEAEAFSPLAPAAASANWLHALTGVAGLLHRLTAETGCAAGHADDPPPPAGPHGPDWEAHVAADVARRRCRATGMAGEGGIAAPGWPDDLPGPVLPPGE